jgi:hypothetical protein
VVPVLLFVALLQGSAVCATVGDCRQHALDAAARGDYETFHDFAWRAVQKGKPNDPELMYLLARAQSLSGRPGDALVMLQRLRDLGVTTDAATNDDFRRVRALKGWTEFIATPASVTAAPPTASPPRSAAPASRPLKPTEPAPTATSGSVGPVPDTALTFDAKTIDPVGLAYDAVSKRFLVGDRASSRLVVVDEMSHHVTNLVSAASAEFLGRISGFAIDEKRGDLWVASTDERASALHKLQLVSGRVLLKVATSGERGAARFEDVVIAADGSVLALDAAGGRVFRVRAGGQQLEIALQFGMPGARTIAPASGSTLYIANDDGLMRVDLARGDVVPVRAPDDNALTRIRTLRWHNGSMLALQESASGSRLIRITLRGAETVRRVQVVDASLPPATAGTIAGQSFFYLANGGTIRQVALR